MIKKLIPLLGAVLVAPGIPACNDGKGLLRAKQIESRYEVVGGPVSVADVGDYVLENDQIRVAILGAKDSPGPGVYGGSVVDIDRRRDRGEFSNAQGHDRFSEMFPVANLLVPDPTSVDIKVLKDGSDGQEAVIHVEGNGEFPLRGAQPPSAIRPIYWASSSPTSTRSSASRQTISSAPATSTS